MEQSLSQTILSVFTAIKSGAAAQNNNINEVLEQLFQAPTIIPELVNIASNDADPSNRTLSLMTIQKLISKRNGQFADNEIHLIKSFIIDFIQKETIETNNNYAINIGCTVSSLPAFCGFPEFLNCGAALLQTPERVSLALSFWSQLIDADLINPEFFANFIEGVVNIIIAGLQSENSQVRICAIHLICVIEIKMLCEHFLEQCPNLLAALQHETQVAVFNEENTDESFRLFELFSFLTSIMPDEFGETMDFYLKFTNDVIKNSNFDPFKREIVLQFFTGIALHQPDVFENEIENVLNATFDILCQKCTSEPEYFQTITADHFISNLAGDPDSTDVVFSILMDITEKVKNSGNLIAFRVAINCLTFISDIAIDSFEGSSEEICQLIEAGLQIRDPYFFSDLCKFITALSQNAFESIAPISNQISIELMKLSQHPDSLTCLYNVFYYSPEPPQNYQQIIQSLLSFMNPNNADAVVPCISAIIHNIKGSDEELYSNLRNALIQLLQQNIARSNIFECFAYCTSIAPRLVAEDLPSIMQSMMQDVVSGEDPEAIYKIAQSISDIVKILPIALQPFASHFFQLLAQYVGKWENNQLPENINEEEAEHIQMSYGQAIICISFLFAAYPTEFQGHFQKILEIIQQFLTSGNVNLIIAAASAIENISPFLISVGINPGIFIDKIIDIINNDDDDDSTINLFNALTAILFEHGSQIPPETIARCGDFLTECLQCKVVSLCSQKFIDNEFQGPLMYTLSGFILGGCFNAYGSKVPLITVLLSYLDLPKKKLMQSFSMTALARICFVAPQSSFEIANMLIKPVIQMLSQKRVSDQYKNTYLMTLMYLLTSHPQIITPELVNKIRPLAENSFLNGSSSLKSTASVVLLILAAKFQCQFDPNIIQSILQVYPSTDDEGVVIYASCIQALYSTNQQIFGEIIGKIATIVVGAPIWITSKIDPSIMGAFVQIIKAIPENVLVQILNFNQSDLLSIQKRLQ
ncbi:hypothetical protein TRFO_12428 [Tritrichomonas foetus]|uniref:Importin N-terminal domain-containing protein n=1 Tax=Tritrichomonas foetus TaxID=1144522 RepID=A0A1J4L1A4_9EUKA|nr:hypothetical protein TRFO_12428 [Tritrichomonas foetus]|eukprot:OHT17297.1 hypothetical protein TRFO_12428 [Tritrichomonas foetus]